jgi:hypothetical protein
VAHLDGPATGRQRRRDDSVHVELRDHRRYPDDVRDRIVRTDLVEVRLREFGPVHARLRAPETLEDRPSLVDHGIG